MLTSRLKRRTRPATTGSSVAWPVNLRRTNGAVPPTHWSCNSKCSKASGGKFSLTTELINSFVVFSRGCVNTSTVEPSSRMTPPSITATRSQISRITCISCVMSTIVRPIFSLMSFNNFKMDSVVCGSRADVASSQRRTFGLEAKARAIPTRCF